MSFALSSDKTLELNEKENLILKAIKLLKSRKNSINSERKAKISNIKKANKNLENLKKKGINITIVDARFAKPLDENLIWQLATTHEAIVTIEEGSIGGFGSHVIDFLSKKGLMDSNLKFRSMKLPDIFIDQDKPENMYKLANLDSISIEEQILDVLNSNIILQKQK